MNKQKSDRAVNAEAQHIQPQSFIVRDSRMDSQNELTVSIIPTTDKMALPLLDPRQEKAIKTINRQEGMTGALIRICAHKPDTPDADTLSGFQRGMASTMNCNSYGNKQVAPNTTEFSWVVYKTTNTDLREFVSWTAFYLFTGWWATSNGYEPDQVTPDGTLILDNGSSVESPYQNDSINLENVPTDYYDQY